MREKNEIVTPVIQVSKYRQMDKLPGKKKPGIRRQNHKDILGSRRLREWTWRTFRREPIKPLLYARSPERHCQIFKGITSSSSLLRSSRYRDHTWWALTDEQIKIKNSEVRETSWSRHGSEIKPRTFPIDVYVMHIIANLKQTAQKKTNGQRILRFSLLPKKEIHKHIHQIF